VLLHQLSDATIGDLIEASVLDGLTDHDANNTVALLITIDFPAGASSRAASWNG